MSDGAETSQADPDLRALEDFLVGNRDLERLEALLDRFNILEALGVVRQELRHSDFLAFLMDPRGNHGLGDAFVKRLLQRTLMAAGDVPVSVTPIELERWTLERITVQKEWQYIDILLLDEDHKLAVIVENKIGTGEHSDQLQRYLDIVEQYHPGWQIIPLYLTPSGVVPSHNKYLPVSYGLVCEIIDGLAEGMASVVNEDARSLMTHYTDMLRRNVIVGDSEIGELCRKINQRHRRALDLLNEYSSRVQVDVQILIESLVENEAGLVRDYNSKRELYFGLGSWDTPALRRGSGGTASGRVLLFDFWNPPGSLSLTLYIGPGPKETRRQLLDMARAHPDVFRVTGKPNSNWTAIFSRPFLNREMYEYVDPVDWDKEIHKRWAEFLDDDLPRIDAALKGERWIWEPDEPDEKHSGRGERFGWADGDIGITRRPDEPQE